MFDQLKDIYNLKKQAQEMEKQLQGVSIEGISSDQSVTVVINGKHDLLSVKIADNIALEKDALEKAFKKAYEDASSKLQKILMEKFRGMI